MQIKVKIFNEGIHKNIGELTLKLSDEIAKQIDLEELDSGIKNMLFHDPYRASGLLRLYKKIKNPPLILFIDFYSGKIDFKPKWAFDE